MVTDAGLPRISWEEGFRPSDERRVSDLIVATITEQLAPLAHGYARLFFVVPTPAPYAPAVARLLAADTRGPEAGALRVITLSRGGQCYAMSGEERFRALLPQVFRLGPPELTLIAANCGFDLSAAASDIAGFVLAALQQARPASGTRDLIGLHFDSGDLVERF